MEYFRDWTLEEIVSLGEEGFTFDLNNGEMTGAYVDGIRIA